MEMHWWCCECNTTNSSPDKKSIICSQENCDHHLCSDCYNPQQIGVDRHMNEYVSASQMTMTEYGTGSQLTINKQLAFIREGKSDFKKMKIYTVRARKLMGHHIKHSKIGRAFLKFWRVVGKKTGLKKDRLRIEGKNIPTVVVPSIAQGSEASNSYVYEPEGSTQYTEERYNYEEEDRYNYNTHYVDHRYNYDN